MVHPLNQLKDVKKARGELTRFRKAAAGAPITAAELEEALNAFAEALVKSTEEQIEEALNNFAANLPLAELEHLPAPDTVGDPDADQDDAGELELELEGR